MQINRDFIHKYTRRKKGHDYYAPCHYHIILRKAPGCPSYGSVPFIPGLDDSMRKSVKPLHTKLGKIICGNIWNIAETFPHVRAGQYCVMPDHVHIFLIIKEKTDKHLGKVIGMLKSKIAAEYSSYMGRKISSSEIFEENFTDKVIFLGRDFYVIIDYLNENPYRLAVRQQYPEYFQRKSVFSIDDLEYEAYGNHFIVENPFRMSVRVSRSITPDAFSEYEDRCLEHVAEGGVLVSPFYSNGEKIIMEKAATMGGKLIKIGFEAFPERYKPAKRDFGLCAEGRLLLVAPKISLGKGLTKPIGERLNRLAVHIAERGF